MSFFKYVVLVGVTVGTVPALQGEGRCPGSVSGIRPRFIEDSIVVVPVFLNKSGPYDFVLDTGAQMTTVDPSLADELHLKQEGTTSVTGAGFSTRASYARLESLQAGTHAIRDPLLLVLPLGQIQISDRKVRGTLGENFIEHFDMLIDYAHSMVCLDDTKNMREKVKGEHIALAAPLHPERNLPFTQPLVLPVYIAGVSAGPLPLQLDSGINAPMLFDAAMLSSAQPVSASLSSRGTDGVSHAYAVLEAQDIQVGLHRLRHISFVAPVSAGKDIPRSGIDGVLPTALFRSVFISYEGNFAVLEQW